MHKKYIVRLTAEEREILKGIHAAPAVAEQEFPAARETLHHRHQPKKKSVVDFQRRPRLARTAVHRFFLLPASWLRARCRPRAAHDSKTPENPAKGLRPLPLQGDEDSRSERPGDAEAIVVVPVPGLVPEAVRGAKAPRFIVPRPAAQNTPTAFAVHFFAMASNSVGRGSC